MPAILESEEAELSLEVQRKTIGQMRFSDYQTHIDTNAFMENLRWTIGL